MAKEKEMKYYKNKLWDLTTQIARFIYPNVCYTCGRAGLQGANWHTGHFLPSGSCGLFLRYDFRNLRSQCFACNRNYGGEGAEFYRRMVREVGQAAVDKLFEEKKIKLESSREWYVAMMLQRTAVLETLRKQKAENLNKSLLSKDDL